MLLGREVSLLFIQILAVPRDFACVKIDYIYRGSKVVEQLLLDNIVILQQFRNSFYTTYMF